MSIERVAQPFYRLARPDFGHIVFTRGSSESCLWPQAVTFARERGGVLQSAREAIAFRLEAGGQDQADLYHATRTVALYFMDGSAFYAAIDDATDPEQNIILARAGEGHNAYQTQRRWTLPKTDRHIRGMLARAEKRDRVFTVDEKSPLELATEQAGGRSDFGNHSSTKAILGDVGEGYAEFLAEKCYGKGWTYTLTPTDLEPLKLGNRNVEVRLVGLGSENVSDLYAISAAYRCDSTGIARGVLPTPVQLEKR